MDAFWQNRRESLFDIDDCQHLYQEEEEEEEEQEDIVEQLSGLACINDEFGCDILHPVPVDDALILSPILTIFNSQHPCFHISHSTWISLYKPLDT